MAEHYYSEEQKSELKLRKISARLRGIEIEMWTGAGVFSPKKVDKGSELLANDCIMEDKWRVLDLGCGYGAVGIAAAKAFPSSEVVMTDINKRAVRIAKMNIRLHRLKNASAVQGDMYQKAEGKFDTILLNPPQTAGKEICFRMIELAKEHLKKGGLLQIVARHNKGGKTLSEKMKETFGSVEEISKKSGYRIYAARS
jgi:16S rRNA G1207 methylase RsmC